MFTSLPYGYLGHFENPGLIDCLASLAIGQRPFHVGLIIIGLSPEMRSIPMRFL